MGGTFNPVHMGHLVMAEAVMHSVEADGMIFIPARLHPFKPDNHVNNYDQRREMVRAALSSNHRFVLEDSPPDLQYTIDLIDYLQGKYTAVELLLIIGSDLVEEFESWHKYEEIVDRIKIVIAARPGYSFNTAGNDVLKGAERIMIPQYDVSSCDIRERVRSRMSIKYMVPAEVEKIIYQEGLYVKG
ncbi:MAG: nicotinate (nicotinamide) nucleotide adenylyltransferase [FCB group bacterium]|nr:nicotinate (nicotinamide) nucleotide adenylyltransferase [FCB group bacterium]